MTSLAGMARIILTMTRRQPQIDESERLLMAHSLHLRAILEQSRQQFRDGQWLSEEEFWSQFEHVKPSKERPKPTRKRADA